MPQTDDKVRENRARRWAKRLDIQLVKSHARRIHADNLGGYMMVDPHTGGIIQGSRFEMEIEDVEEYLDWYEKSLKEAK